MAGQQQTLSQGQERQTGKCILLCQTIIAVGLIFAIDINFVQQCYEGISFVTRDKRNNKIRI